jgi:HEAT repeat protein
VRCRLLTLLLCLGVPAAGEDAEPPLIFFLEPDDQSAQAILHNVKHLNDGTRDQRRHRRATLVDYGLWAVPFLTESIHGRKANGDLRIRMGASMCLGAIRDSRGLDALRAAAKEDQNRWVRQTALLVIGQFEQSADTLLLLSALQDKDLNHKHQPAAGLALARLRSDKAAAELLSFAQKKRLNKHILAACILGVAVSTPAIEDVWTLCSTHLAHDDKLVRRVAAASLMLRPDAILDPDALLKTIKKTRDKNVRASLYLALAAVPRTDEIRGALLDAVAKEKGKVRIWAAIGLAKEWGERETYDRLKRLHRNLKDPEAAAVYFAMVRTGAPRAVDELLRIGKDDLDRAFYASGALGHLIYVQSVNEPHRRTEEIQKRFIELRASGLRGAKGDHLKALLDKLIDLRWDKKDRAVRRDKALAAFREIGDPFNLGLWHLSLEERAQDEANRLLLPILALDDIQDIGEASPKVGGEGAPRIDTGGPDPAVASSSPEEVDLIDYLSSGYFQREDFRGD